MTSRPRAWGTTTTRGALVAAVALAGCGGGNNAAGPGAWSFTPRQPVAGEVFEVSFPGELLVGLEWILTFTDGPAAGRVFILSQGNEHEAPSVVESVDGEIFYRLVLLPPRPGETVTVQLLAPADVAGSATLCNADETACEPIEIRP